MKRATFFWWLRMLVIQSSLAGFIFRLYGDSWMSAEAAILIGALLTWYEATTYEQP